MVDGVKRVFTEAESNILLTSLALKIASLDRASKGYTMGSNMYLAVREDIQAVRKLYEKIGGM